MMDAKSPLYKESVFTQFFQAMCYFVLDTAFENHTHEYTNRQETRQRLTAEYQ